MPTNWRISTLNGVLLAGYFIPVWTITAFRIITSPIQGLFERPNVAFGLFISDHLHLAAGSTIRAAWLLALGRFTVVAFFAVFLAMTTNRSMRRGGGSSEALGLALLLGSLISFASMLLASQAGELLALRLHVTELLMLLGTAAVLLVERPISPATPLVV